MFDVEGYLTEKRWPFKQAGQYEVHGPCFFCDESHDKRGRLYVNTDPNADPPGLFMCHLCDESGAINKIRKHFGDPVLKEDQEIEVSYRKTQIYEFATNHYHELLTENEDAFNYWYDQCGFDVETITSHKLGWSDGKTLIPALFNKGFSKEEIIDSGLMNRYGNEELAGMLTIPYLHFGSALSVRGRSLTDSGPKYKSLPRTKSRLFNADLASHAAQVIITEGEKDAMTLERLGFTAVGIPGAVGWQDHWNDYLADASQIFICLDNDSAGKTGAEKIALALGSKARIVNMPEAREGENKNDPTEWIVHKGNTVDDFKMLLIRARGGHLLTVDEAYQEWEDELDSPGLKFGIEVIDQRIAPGLKPGQVAVLLAKSGAGKQEPVSAEIPTPSGYRRIGDLKIGDYIFGQKGQPNKVVGVFPQGKIENCRVLFSDGTSRIVGWEHLWQVQSRGGHNREWIPQVLSSRELLDLGLRCGYGNAEWKWQIPMCEPVQYPEADLPVDPYVVGSLLANGTTTAYVVLTTPDEEVINRVSKHVEVKKILASEKWKDRCPRYGLPKMMATMRNLGMDKPSKDKRIPEIYLLGSVEQRLALLQGLMDGDGSGSSPNRSSVKYYTISEGLAHDVRELVNSLGGTAKINSNDRTDEGKPLEYRLSILLPEQIEPFYSSRKTRGKVVNRIVPKRAIVGIEPVEAEESVCIAVEAEDHLYLSGRSYTVTHNTQFLLNLFQSMMSLDDFTKILFISLEQTRSEWFERARRIFRFYNPDATDRECLDFFRHRLLIVDKNRLSEEEFITCLEQFEFETGKKPDLVAVDYLGYWARGFKGESYERTGAAMHALKAIAKDQRIAIFAPHQVNRGVRYGEEIEADSARDAGTVEETADFVFSLIGEDQTKGRTEDELTGQKKMKILKSRHGGANTVVSFQTAPVSLAMVPVGNALTKRAKDELKMYQARDDFETIIYRHSTGDNRIIGFENDFDLWKSKLGVQ